MSGHRRYAHYLTDAPGREADLKPPRNKPLPTRGWVSAENLPAGTYRCFLENDQASFNTEEQGTLAHVLGWALSTQHAEEIYIWNEAVHTYDLYTPEQAEELRLASSHDPST